MTKSNLIDVSGEVHGGSWQFSWIVREWHPHEWPKAMIF